MKSIKETAQNQLGTIGSGNHYVDIFEDEDGSPKVLVGAGNAQERSQQIPSQGKRAAGGNAAQPVKSGYVRSRSLMSRSASGQVMPNAGSFQRTPRAEAGSYDFVIW